MCNDTHFWHEAEDLIEIYSAFIILPIRNFNELFCNTRIYHCTNTLQYALLQSWISPAMRTFILYILLSTKCFKEKCRYPPNVLSHFAGIHHFLQLKYKRLPQAILKATFFLNNHYNIYFVIVIVLGLVDKSSVIV